MPSLLVPLDLIWYSPFFSRSAGGVMLLWFISDFNLSMTELRELLRFAWACCAADNWFFCNKLCGEGKGDVTCGGKQIRVVNMDNE